MSDDRVELYADRIRGLPVVDPEDRALIISFGASLFHLRLALKHFGYSGEVETFPDPDNPDLLARVRLGSEHGATEEERSLFRAIPKRHSNRQAFEDRRVPERLLAALQEAAREEGAWLYVAQEADAKHAIAELIGEGDRVQWADKRFRRELASWMHPNRSCCRDGMPGYAFGFDDVMAAVGPLVMRTFDLGKGQVAKDRQLADGSPVLAVLGTEADESAEWLSAGQALALFAASAVAGSFVGTYLVRYIPQGMLRKSFAVFLVLMSIFIIYENRQVIPFL
ncbi:MAG: hypothetical protein M3305_15560 [Actinomycetota bacterium]|nr:hypothetical protein [Actinomycetota bacterium]